MNPSESTAAASSRRYLSALVCGLALTAVFLPGRLGAQAPAGPFGISGPPELVEAHVGEYYSQEVTATNGIPPYAVTIRRGVLPAGLTASSSGFSAIVSGTPVVLETNTFDVELRDLTGQLAVRRYTLRVVPRPFCTSLTNGLVGWWKGDDSARDSARTNHGVWSDGTGFVPGMIESAFSLDGTNGRVRIDYSASLVVTGALTVQAWIRPNRAGTNLVQTILGKANSQLGQNWWFLDLAGDRLRFWVSRNGIPSGARYAESGPGLILPGVWSHVAGAFDPVARTMRIFINGAEAPTTFLVDTLVTAIPNSAIPLYLGCRVGTSGAPTNFFGGEIDEVTLFDRALTADEVRAVAMAGASGGCVVAPVLVAPETLPAGGVGGGYSWLLQGERGLPPYRYYLAVGTLPPGVSLQANGVLAGIPVEEGLWTMEFGLVDARGQAGPDSRRICSITVTAGPPACLSPPAGLVGWWSGDHHRADLAGTNHASLINGAGYGDGVTAGAFGFDGVNDYVQVGGGTALRVTNDPVTVAAWIHPAGPDSASTYGILLGREGEYLLKRETNGTVWAWLRNIQPGSVWVDLNLVAPPGQWTHVAMVYDGVFLRAYQNGARTFQVGAHGPIGDLYPAANDFRIGGRQLFTQPFAGWIDEVQVFRRGLTDTEVREMHQAGRAGLCRPSLPCQTPGGPTPPGGPFPVTASLNQLGLAPADEYRPYSNHVASAFCGQPVTYALVGTPLPAGLRLEPDGRILGDAPERGLILFQVTVTDAMGWSATASVSLRILPATPYFSRWPEGRSLRLGETLWLTAETRAPATWQWYFNATPIPDATNAELAIAQVSTAQAGRYWARAFNDVGGSDSPAALVQITEPPAAVSGPALLPQAVGLNPSGAIQLQITTVPGRIYLLQRSTAIRPDGSTEWWTIRRFTAGETLAAVEDPAPPDPTQGFYRVIEEETAENPVAFAVTDHTRLIGIAADGQARPGLLPGYDPATGRIGPLEFRPGGKHAASDRQLLVRLPAGGHWIVDANGEAAIETDQAEIAFAADSPIQLARPLRLAGGGVTSRIPVGPLDVPTLERLYQSADGTPVGTGVEVVVFRHYHLRLTRGQFDADRIRQAQLSWVEQAGQSGRRPLPLPARSGDYADFDVSLELRDGVLRIPFHGEFSLNDGTTSPALLRVPRSHPLVLELHADNQVSLRGRAEAIFAGGPSFQVDVSLDDPIYRLRLAARNVRVPVALTVPELLPVPAIGAATDEATLDGQIGQLRTAFTAHRAFLGLLAADADLPESEACGDTAPIGITPGSADGAVAFWASLVQAGALATFPEELLRAADTAAGTAAASEDAGAAVRCLVELQRLHRSARSAGLRERDRMAAAYAEAAAAAVRMLNDAPESMSLGDLGRILEAGTALEQILEAGEPAQVSEVIPALRRLVERAAEHYVTVELGLTPGQSASSAAPAIDGMPRWEALRHLERLLQLECADEQLGGNLGLDRWPLGDAVSRLGQHLTSQTRRALGLALTDREPFRYRAVLGELHRLLSVGQLLGVNDGSFPSQTEWEAAFGDRTALGLSGPDGLTERTPEQLRDDARLLRDMAPPGGTAAPDATFAAWHAQLGQRLAALFSTAATGPARPAANWLARLEAHLIHEELRLRYHLQADDASLRFQMENAAELLVQQAVCGRGDALVEAARLVIESARRLDDPRLRDAFSCQPAGPAAAPAASVAGARLALHQLSARLLDASKAAAGRLWLESSAGRQVDPSLALADMMLPGGFAIEEAAGELSYDARQRRLRGSLRGRLRVPQFGATLAVTEASFDSGGAFRMSAYGAASFPRSHPTLRLEVPARRPLKVELDLNRHFSISGGVRVGLQNGMSFEGWLTLDDPFYQVGARATGLRVNLADRLTGQIQVLDRDHLERLGPGLRDVVRDYVTGLGATLDPLTDLTEAPRFGTVGEPPAFQESVFTIESAPITVTGRGLRLALQDPAAMGFAAGADLHQWATNLMATADVEIDGMILKWKLDTAPGVDPAVTLRQRPCEMKDQLAELSELDLGIREYNQAHPPEKQIDRRRLDQLLAESVGLLKVSLDDSGTGQDGETVECVLAAAQTLAEVELRGGAEDQPDSPSRRLAAAAAIRLFQLGSADVTAMNQALAAGGPAAASVTLDRLNEATERIQLAMAYDQAMELRGPDRQRVVVDWAPSWTRDLYIVHRNVVRRELTKLAETADKDSVVASYIAYQAGIERVAAMEYYRMNLPDDPSNGGDIPIYGTNGAIVSRVNADARLGAAGAFNDEVFQGAGRKYVQLLERMASGPTHEDRVDSAKVDAFRERERALRKANPGRTFLEILHEEQRAGRIPGEAYEDLRQKLKPAARAEYEFWKASMIRRQFKLDGISALGTLRRTLALARDLELSGWSAFQAGNENQDLLDDFEATLLPGLRVEIAALARARQAWWIATQAAGVLHEGMRAKAVNDFGIVDRAARTAADELLFAAADLVRVLQDHLRTDWANLDLRLPGDLLVREAWGQLTVNTRDRYFQGCFGGALEFPDLAGFRVSIPMLCVGTDGSFNFVGQVANLPVGDWGADPVKFSGSLVVNGKGDPPVDLSGNEPAFHLSWPGRIELSGQGQVARGTGPGAATAGGSLRYAQEPVGDSIRWRLSVDVSFEGVEKLGDDLVLFKANAGFGADAPPGGGNDNTAVTLRAGAKVGIWRKDRSRPLPADPAEIRPELFQLVVDDVQWVLSELTDPPDTTELRISKGTLRLPDVFYPKTLPEGLVCPQAPGTTRTGAAIQIVEAAPLVLRLPRENGGFGAPSLNGELRFTHFGFSFAGLDQFGASICDATLAFTAHGPALRVGEGRLALPLPGKNLVLALRNAQFDLQGLPVGEIALAEPFELLDLGGFRVVMMAPGHLPRFLPPMRADPSSPGTQLVLINPDDPADHGRRNLRFEGGLEVSFPASMLGAEAGTGGRDPRSQPGSDDTATVGAAVTGFFEIRPRGLDVPEVELGLTEFSLGAQNAVWKLGPSGISIEDPSLRFRNLPALWRALAGQVDARDAASVTLGGRLKVANEFSIRLDTAQFIFDQPGGFPRFLMNGLTVQQDPNSKMGLLPVQLTQAGFSFRNPAAPLPDLLHPVNLSVVVSAKIQLPTGGAPLLVGELSNVKIEFNENGLPRLPNLDGVELGLVGDSLKIPPFDAISGKVRLGGLQGQSLNDVYLVGELTAKQQTTQVKVLGAFTWLGPLGLCADVSLGASGMPIAYGFVFLGGQGGISFIEGGGDPCQFTTYFTQDSAGRWVLRSSVVQGVPVPNWADLGLPSWEKFRDTVKAMRELADRLPRPPVPGAPEPPRPPWGGGGAGGRFAPAQANGGAPSPIDPCVDPATEGFTCADCGPCPPRSINLLCQPHPDQAAHTNQVILKFSSIPRDVTREIFAGIPPNLTGDPAALAGELAARALARVSVLTPRPNLASAPALQPLADYLDRALATAGQTISNLLYHAIVDVAQSGAVAIQGAVEDRLYAGIPCSDLTLSLAGRFSYTGLSAFAYVEGRMIESSAGMMGVQGIVNLLGLPVGEGHLFLSATDDQGELNPSVCGEINVALGPLDIGQVNAALRCDGCISTVLGTFPRMARLIGEPLLRRLLQAAAPQLRELEGRTVAQMLTELAALPAEEQRAIQMRFFAALAAAAPRDLPRDLPGEFIRLLGEQWDSIQPELRAWGGVGPKLFGIPLTPGGGTVAQFDFKMTKEGYVGGFEIRPSALNIVFPPGDKARLTFDLRARDATSILLGAMDGRLSSPDRARAFVEEQVDYALQHTTLGVAYQWHPFGLELGDAAVRVLVPDLVSHPARLGPNGWRTPEQDGLPSRAEILIAAAAGGHLGNVRCWSGDATDFGNIFPDADDPRRAAVAGLELRKRYFPHGGVIGGARMALPKILSESPREWLPLLETVTGNGDLLERISTASALIQDHILATELAGTAAFYLPAPNPPASDTFNLTPAGLLERIRKLDVSATGIRDLYPGEYSFLQADMTNVNLFGMPIGVARLRGSLAPTSIRDPGPIATLTVEVDRDSWVGRVAGRPFAMSADLYAVPPRAIQDRFGELLAALQQEGADHEEALRQVGEALVDNLPKIAFTNPLPDLVVEHPSTWAMRLAVQDPSLPATFPPLFRIDAPILYAFSPRYAPDTPGDDPIAEAARQGGLGFSGSFILLPSSAMEQPRTEAKLALFPDETTGLPRLKGTLRGLPLGFFPGLDLSQTTVDFDSGADEFLIASTTTSSIEFPGRLFRVTPISGPALQARLGLAHHAGGVPFRGSLLPALPSLQLSPALLTSTVLSGVGLRVHGSGGPTTDLKLSPVNWDARVSLTDAAGGGAGDGFLPANGGTLKLTASLGGTDVAIVGIQGLPQGDIFSVDGTSESFALRLDAGPLQALTVTLFPDVPLPAGVPRSVTINPAAVGIQMRIASDGRFEFVGRLGQDVAVSGTSFPAGATVRANNDGVTFSGNVGGSEGSVSLRWMNGGVVASVNIQLVLPALRTPLVSLTAAGGGDFEVQAGTGVPPRLSQPVLTFHAPYFGATDSSFPLGQDLPLTGGDVPSLDQPLSQTIDRLTLRGFPLKHLSDLRARGAFGARPEFTLGFRANVAVSPVFDANFRGELGMEGLKIWLEPPPDNPENRVILLGFPFKHASFGLTNAAGELPSLRFSGELAIDLPWPGGVGPRFSGFIPAVGAFNLDPTELPAGLDLGFPLRALRQAFQYQPGGYVDLIRRDGPAGYWRLEEEIPDQTLAEPWAKTLADSSAAANAAGVYQPDIPNQPGMPSPPVGRVPGAFAAGDNRGVRLDGVDDHGRIDLTPANAARLSQSKTIAVELWFKRTDPTRLASFEGEALADSGSRWKLWLVGRASPTPGTRVAFAVGGLTNRSGAAINFIHGNSIVDDADWHHVVATYDGFSVQLFLDGKLDAMVPAQGSPISDPGPMILGAARYPLNGQEVILGHVHAVLDEVALYDRALSPVEVYAHFLAAGGGGLRFSANLGDLTGVSGLKDAGVEGFAGRDGSVALQVTAPMQASLGSLSLPGFTGNLLWRSGDALLTFRAELPPPPGFSGSNFKAGGHLRRDGSFQLSGQGDRLDLPQPPLANADQRFRLRDVQLSASRAAMGGIVNSAAARLEFPNFLGGGEVSIRGTFAPLSMDVRTEKSFTVGPGKFNLNHFKLTAQKLDASGEFLAGGGSFGAGLKANGDGVQFTATGDTGWVGASGQKCFNECVFGYPDVWGDWHCLRWESVCVEASLSPPYMNLNWDLRVDAAPTRVAATVGGWFRVRTGAGPDAGYSLLNFHPPRINVSIDGGVKIEQAADVFRYFLPKLW